MIQSGHILSGMGQTSFKERYRIVLSLQRDECSEKINWEENGMEVTVGELRAPTFYFLNEMKFWQQVQQLLKSQSQWDQWLENIIYQKFVTEWIKEPFTPRYLKRNASCNFK